MLIIGHRGAAGLADENTLSSLKKAEEIGADIAEFDLRETSDGEVVIIHDKTLHRTHDDRRAVKHLTLAEIKAIGEQEAREIPTLTELIAAANIPLNLEIKESGFEQQVIDAIKNFSREVLVSSSNPLVLKKIRTLDEKVKLGFILGPKWEIFFPWAMHIAKTLDLYSINPYRTLVTPKHMKAMREHKLKIFVWTVDDKHEFEITKGFGVDGIFTDYPNLFKNA